MYFSNIIFVNSLIALIQELTVCIIRRERMSVGLVIILLILSFTFPILTTGSVCKEGISYMGICMFSLTKLGRYLLHCT